MNVTSRTFVSCLIAFVIMGALYVSMPNYAFQPQGVVLPTQGARKAFHGKVKRYDASTIPVGAENIGKITVEYHNLIATPKALRRIIDKANQLAAKAGGNGLAFSIGHSTTSTPSILQVLMLEGTVIRTTSEGK